LVHFFFQNFSALNQSQENNNSCTSSVVVLPGVFIGLGSSSRLCKFQLDYYFSCLKNFFTDYFVMCF